MPLFSFSAKNGDSFWGKCLPATWALVIMAASPLNMPACCLETTSAWGSIQIKASRRSTLITASVIFKGYFPWQAWSCSIKLVLYFTFLVLYFFYVIIHLNTTVLENNIVTYLNIVKIKLTTLFIERLGSSSCHFHIVLWYHRWCIVHINEKLLNFSYPLKSSWI